MLLLLKVFQKLPFTVLHRCCNHFFFPLLERSRSAPHRVYKATEDAVERHPTLLQPLNHQTNPKPQTNQPTMKVIIAALLVLAVIAAASAQYLYGGYRAYGVPGESFFSCLD